MPLIFAISIGATVSLVAIVMFGLAWYQYESRVVLRELVIETPTHTESYERIKAEQMQSLGDIEAAMLSVAKSGGDEGHGSDHGGGKAD